VDAQETSNGTSRHPAIRVTGMAATAVALGPAALASLLEALPIAAGLCDAACRLLYGNALLTAFSAHQPAREALCREVHRMAKSRSAVSASPADGRPLLEHGPRIIRSGSRRYRAGVSVIAMDARGAASLFLVYATLVESDPASAEEIRRHFRLTKQESRVAALLAQGKSNAAIAVALHISPHTARRHTESIMAKLSTASRAEVAARILRIGESSYVRPSATP
jgi:DNA-binding CsgD family transcriptional regulator